MIPPGGRLQLRRPNRRCSGVAARWCEVHGDCTCDPDDLNDETCPLHSSRSNHAEP